MTENNLIVAEEKKQSKVEEWADKYSPAWLKKLCAKIISFLPARMEKWIMNNKAKALIIFFTFRGLFLRPSMWAIYIALFAYISGQ